MSIFPYNYQETLLEQIDFKRFSQSFSELVIQKVPTATTAKFYLLQDALREDLGKGGKGKKILSILEQYESLLDLAFSFDDCIIFSIPVVDKEQVLVLLDNLDPLVVKRFGDDWLAEVRQRIISDCILLKQARIDQETGLFNSSNMHYLLDSLTDYEQVNLLLISLPPNMRNPLHSVYHARKAAVLLKNFFGEASAVHHLGQSVFGFVSVQYDEDLLNNISASLVTYLKHEGFPKVHIGSGRGRGIHDSVSKDVDIRSQLVNEAWKALEAAVNRGPFSFCSFASLAYPEKHLLSKPDERLYRFFRKRWKDDDQFCMVRYVPTGEVGIETLADYLIAKGITAARREGSALYMYMAGYSGDECAEKVEFILQGFSRATGAKHTSFSVGIAPYPYSSFSKAESLINSKKACLHGEFFGPGSMVVFDEVSLNISGDIYYAEGDMRNAVKEYQNGLQCNSDDVNLLNSLGVTRVFMNQYLKGQDCFKKALRIEPNNFMALYNFGLGEERAGRIEEAVYNFEKALKAHDQEQDGEEICQELECNLGRLYCQLGKYQKALSFLEKQGDVVKSDAAQGRQYRLLGVAYAGAGENKRAIKWLQRALQINEFDAESLNLLGQVYMKEKQGDEIALSLCEKSVDLEPDNIVYLLGLATVQLSCGELEKAIVNLRKCIRYKKVREQAGKQMVCYYLLVGDKKKADYWKTRYTNQLVN